MIKLLNTGIFINIIVYCAATTQYTDVNIEKRFYTDEYCYPDVEFESSPFLDGKPKACVNSLNFNKLNEENDAPTSTHIKGYQSYDDGRVNTITCVFEPQSIIKLKYYEKRGTSNKLILESTDKGRVLAHIKLDSRRSPSHVVCEFYRSDGNFEKNDNVTIYMTFNSSNPYTNFVVNDMLLPTSIRVQEYPVYKLGHFSEYFANPGELLSVALDHFSEINSCNVSSGFQNVTTDFAKERKGEFIFNSTEATIECTVATFKIPYILTAMPYSQMPSSLSSDFIFIKGFFWNNMMNKYVRRNLEEYNFIYTYHYNTDYLKLTCVSQFSHTWIHNGDAVQIVESKNYTDSNAYFGDITLKVNKGYNDTVISCVSASGHTATVVLHRFEYNSIYYEDNNLEIKDILNINKYKEPAHTSEVTKISGETITPETSMDIMPIEAVYANISEEITISEVLFTEPNKVSTISDETMKTDTSQEAVPTEPLHIITSKETTTTKALNAYTIKGVTTSNANSFWNIGPSKALQNKSEAQQHDGSNNYGEGRNSTRDTTPHIETNLKMSDTNEPCNNDKDVDNKIELANQAFGAFIGHELNNVPVYKRRFYMYNIIKSMNDNN